MDHFWQRACPALMPFSNQLIALLVEACLKEGSTQRLSGCHSRVVRAEPCLQPVQHAKISSESATSKHF